MEQELNGENEVKEGNGTVPNKLGHNGKLHSGRAAGPAGPSMAMKIPGKQAPKNQITTKKGRPPKNGSTPKENVTQNHTNGNQPLGQSNTKTPRDGRRPQKDERPAKRHTLPIVQNSKSRSQNSSRNSSVSPVEGRKEMDDGGDENAEEIDEKENEQGGGIEAADLEVTTQGLKQLLSIGNPARIMYSRIQLLNISENPSSKYRPECLEKDFNASNGRWDPENWHRSLSSPPATTGERVRKFSFSDRDRYPDDPSQGGIVLGPQRRSFQDGCHVTNNSGTASRLSKLHAGSPTEPTSRHARPRLVIRHLSESVSEFEGGNPANRERQIESASALRTEEFDWDRDRDRDGRRGDSLYRERDLSDLRPEPRGRRELPRDLHELRSEYGRDNRDGDYRGNYRERKFSHNSRDFGSSGWYQGRNEGRQHRYNNEPEPEWYTAGPTSQFDTIELGGFDDVPTEAAADFSSWGGEIPMDDVEPGKKESEKEEKDGELEEKSDKGLEGDGETKRQEAKEDSPPAEGGEKKADTEAAVTADKAQTEGSVPKQLDLNELLGFDLPGFSSAISQMEQILGERGGAKLPSKDEVSAENGAQGGSNALSASSRFSQWFQREQIEQLKKGEGGSRGSTPHEELENLAELAAERGLASPVDVESKQQVPVKNDIMRLLTQTKPGSGNVSPSMRSEVLSLEQQELARRLLMQQVKSGAAMNVAELEAKAGARQSPQSQYGGVDMENTEAFNKLVASIREKDKIRQRQLLAQQQALKYAEANQIPVNQIGHPRIPSPEELAAHTQNIFQQALIKKQLEKQKEAYKEKIRQIEQQRREEQLREAIRSADAKLQESKNMNKSLAFMPTSVMRKMQENREGKMQEQELYNLQQQQQQQQMMEGTHPDALASATASFSAKLAKQKSGPQGGNNDLLARIYQSASQTKPDPSLGRGDNHGLRRNASFPDVLMDSKMQRNSAFHQPVRQNPAAVNLDLNKLNNESESARFRNLLAMSNEMQSANLLNKPLGKPPGGLKTQHSVPSGGVAADYYNNNLLKENQALGGKVGSDPHRKISAEAADMSELKNQHEVALLTQAVLNKFGINEDQLSRLTPQQQQAVVSIVQEQYYHLQFQKQRLLMEKGGQKDINNPPKLKQGDLPPPNAAKNDMQAAMSKNGTDPGEPRGNPAAPLSIPKSGPVPVSAGGVKLTQQQLNAMGGVGGGIPGILPSNPHIHPLQLRPMVPPMAQFIPPPMARGIIPTTFLPPQHMPGRLMAPPPPNVPLASPLGPPYQAAALMQMQLYHQQQQQQQRAMLAAALQQQQIAQQQAAYAAARQQQQNAKENSRGGNQEFTNPLERWFGRDVLSQSQLPPFHKPTAAMVATDIERMNVTNQKQE